MMLNVQQVWYVDKNLPKSLFLQLADNIKWSIRTGNILPGERLPSLRAIAKEIGISIDTARAAYKLLEDEGYVVTRPHLGTVIKGPAAREEKTAAAPPKPPQTQDISDLLLHYINEGKNEEDLRQLIENSLKDALHKSSIPHILFAECDDAYGEAPAKALADGLGAKIHFINIRTLGNITAQIDLEKIRYKAIITTYFHYSMVQEVFGALDIPVFGVVLEFAPQTISAISKLPTSTKIGLICDTKDFKEYHVNQIRTLRDDLEIRSAFASDDLDATLGWADVFFVSFSQRHRLACQVEPERIFYYSDHINEQSIGLVNKMLNYIPESRCTNES